MTDDAAHLKAPQIGSAMRSARRVTIVMIFGVPVAPQAAHCLAPFGRVCKSCPPMQLADLKWPVVKGLSKDIPVAIPVAALEQHGPHLPLFTDSLLLGEIIRRAAERLADTVLFAPLMWLGNSDHHLDFPGTLSARPRLYLDLLAGIIDDLVAHGFRRLVFVNGHGGNIVPGRQVIFEARQRYRTRSDVLFVFATYWELGVMSPGALGSFQQKAMGHACEWETSMILRLNPSLVGEFKSLRPCQTSDTVAPAHRGWITKDFTSDGYIGFPHLATAEKGEALFATFAEHLVTFLGRVSAWDGKQY